MVSRAAAPAPFSLAIMAAPQPGNVRRAPTPPQKKISRHKSTAADRYARPDIAVGRVSLAISGCGLREAVVPFVACPPASVPRVGGDTVHPHGTKTASYAVLHASKRLVYHSDFHANANIYCAVNISDGFRQETALMLLLVLYSHEASSVR